MKAEELFAEPLPLRNNIYHALERHPRLPLAQASNFLPLTAKLYEPLWRRRSLGLLTLGGYSTARELELMRQWLAPAPGETVLDAACSAGLYARSLLEQDSSLQVHALDMSLPFLEQAGHYAEARGLSPVLVWGDVRALPYRDRVFDAVVCGGSLNEFTELPLSLSELARVLKPAGRLWLMYLARAGGWGGRTLQGLARLTGIRFPTPEGLERQAQAAGLTLLRTQRRGVVAMSLFRKAA